MGLVCLLILSIIWFFLPTLLYIIGDTNSETSNTGGGEKQLSASFDTYEGSSYAHGLTIYNQNNFDWHNAKVIVNGVWIDEIGNLDVGQLKVLTDYEDENGQTMPVLTQIEKIKIISDEGSAVYSPRW
ncbi:MAG: hypothetical protein KAU95_00130 [Candidatus Aenigmarchaeota archaeon]|nr:hypothetical protein [Candidatus Aenigmarchaeota archaeon]